MDDLLDNITNLIHEVELIIPNELLDKKLQWCCDKVKKCTTSSNMDIIRKSNKSFVYKTDHEILLIFVKETWEKIFKISLDSVKVKKTLKIKISEVVPEVPEVVPEVSEVVPEVFEVVPEVSEEVFEVDSVDVTPPTPTVSDSEEKIEPKKRGRKPKNSKI